MSRSMDMRMQLVSRIMRLNYRASPGELDAEKIIQQADKLVSYICSSDEKEKAHLVISAELLETLHRIHGQYIPTNALAGALNVDASRSQIAQTMYTLGYARKQRRFGRVTCKAYYKVA